MTLGVFAAAGVLIGSMAAAQDESHRPETWFHLIGGNASKPGLTADLEAIREAGIGGVQFFHGQFGGPWPGVPEQIPCLSEKWDDLVRHIAVECKRLNLSLKFQNCPGWSMSGGPWIDDSTSMRKLVLNASGRDYRPVCEMSVPRPAGEDEDALTPVSVVTNGAFRTYAFSQDVTLRSLILPSAQAFNHYFCYDPGLGVALSVKVGGTWKTVFERTYPPSNFSDDLPRTFAFAATTGRVWRIEFRNRHEITMNNGWADPVFSSACRMDDWEGRSGLTLRGLEPVPDFPVSTGTGQMTLRFGHVNAERTNHPAPKEATGWECDKLDPRGIEANFAGYVGRLLDGPLKGLPVKGLVVDSWECGSQNWTWRMPEYFKAINGYGLERWLPALFGHVVDSPCATDSFLRDWRRTQGELVKENYYRRFAELAHERGLEVQYEAAMGDVVSGDILSYWKYADTPMCEFWSPHDDAHGYVTSYDFKPVRPCVSASHIYGKPRTAAEAFTSFRLTWDETLADFKRDADKHYARGVTHLVFHTFTHNPRVGMNPPGSAFGCGVGSPFMRGQSWWPKMKLLTDYFARCGEVLESGKPVVDVLWYVGDDCAHKPSENHPFPRGWKYDYITFDALSTWAKAEGGRVVFPDGMTYRLVWVPSDVYLRPETISRLDEMEKSGARIVRGDIQTLTEALVGEAPDLVYQSPEGERPDDFMWYHRKLPSEDVYFLATSCTNGYRGDVRFRAGSALAHVELPPNGSAFAHIRDGKVEMEYPARSSSGQMPSRAVNAVPVALDRCRMTTPYEAAPFRTYATNLVLTAADCRKGLGLDFGSVRGVLDVKVNGRLVSSLWCEPYVCEVGYAVKPGENDIEILWTGTWRKRLFMDARLPSESRKTWTEPFPN